MKYFFDTDDWRTTLAAIAIQYRSAYARAQIFKAIKIVFKLAFWIMSIIALIKLFVAPPLFYAIWFGLQAVYWIMDFMQSLGYHTFDQSACTPEYFQIQEKIVDMITVPQELRQLNPNLNNRSFALMQSKDGYYVLAFKTCMQFFPAVLITDKICSMFIQKYVEKGTADPPIDYIIQADLNLNELKSRDINVMLFQNKEEAVSTKINNKKELDEQLAKMDKVWQYGVITIIDREIPENLGLISADDENATSVNPSD